MRGAWWLGRRCRGLATVANASVIGSWLAGDEVASEFNIGAIFLGLAAVAVIVAAVSCLYCYLSWKMTRYAVTSTAVWYRAGILKRTQRHARCRASRPSMCRIRCWVASSASAS